MINTRLLVICLMLQYLNPVWATPVSHPDFQPARGEIELKSTATATWLAFIDVYDAALYTSPDAQSGSLLEADAPFSLEIRYKVSLSKDQLIEGADVALGRQHTKQRIAAYQSEVDALHTHYRNVDEGDRFRLDISNPGGLALFFNNELLYENSDVDFALYYVGLWLAENPFSDAVREGLLDW